MLDIKHRRKKSIKARLVMDFGSILIGICIFNYLLVSLIYKDILKKSSVYRSKVITNAAITQSQLIIQDSANSMNNILKLEYLLDDEMNLEDKVEHLKYYASPFYDIGILELDGTGKTFRGGAFVINDKGVFKNAIEGKFNVLDIMKYKGQSYIVLMRPINDEAGQLHSILIGVRDMGEFFYQIMDVSSTDICFIANSQGSGVICIKDGDKVGEIHEIKQDTDFRELYNKVSLTGREYEMEVKDSVRGIVAKLNYGKMGESGLVLGTIKEQDAHKMDLRNLRVAMIIGMIIASSIGVLIIYYIVTSITKRMRHIAVHLEGNIKNEFKDSIPVELVENEDELGSIAKEIKNLEEEMGNMLTSIKESVDYLNDKMSEMTELYNNEEDIH